MPARSPGQMIEQLLAHVRNSPLITRGQHPVPKMLRVQILANVDEAVDEKQPGRSEVIVASPTTVAERAGYLPREAPVGEPERCGITAIARVPPVQFREIEKDVDAAPKQVHTRDEIDPVTDPDVVRVGAARLLRGGTRGFR